MNLAHLVRAEIREQKAYFVEHVPCPIKLDANENPYGLTPELKERFMASLSAIALNRYPEAGSLSLRTPFAAHFGVPADGLMIGNGSDELIAILCTALSSPGSRVLIPTPPFAMYRISAVNSGHRVIEVPLGADYDLDREAILTA
ncbi:MAG: aminotransferase class I/II-fold pyridoxal phosphate-dependent enzyme, partial [Syntrophales bacterium]|nr:aminotransferase class I/II-fold pyridoxal phosphate-dependent enzyme [Syntrophales bacterium]